MRRFVNSEGRTFFARMNNRVLEVSPFKDEYTPLRWQPADTLNYELQRLAEDAVGEKPPVIIYSDKRDEVSATVEKAEGAKYRVRLCFLGRGLEHMPLRTVTFRSSERAVNFAKLWVEG